MFYFIYSQALFILKVFFLTMFFFFLFAEFQEIENTKTNLNDIYEIEEGEVNYIQIPAILLESTLCEKNGKDCLEDGVWLKYFDLYKKNFLFTGHNFHLYPLRAGVFYNLEDVETGDHVYVYFDSKIFVFEIYDFFVTNRYNTGIEDFNHQEKTLRIYTCYPPWGNRDRFVVEGRYVNLF